MVLIVQEPARRGKRFRFGKISPGDGLSEHERHAWADAGRVCGLAPCAKVSWVPYGPGLGLTGCGVATEGLGVDGLGFDGVETDGDPDGGPDCAFTCEAAAVSSEVSAALLYDTTKLVPELKRFDVMS